MENEKNSLEKFKKTYKILQKNYSLPSFEEMNQDFNIEKISQIETDYPLREIRKLISEKFSAYLRFIENLIHPVNSSMFIMSIVKTIDLDNQKFISEIYKKLAKKESELLSLDLEFSIERDVKYIVDSFRFWQEIKKDISKISELINSNWDKKIEIGKKEYFG
jgi:RNA processing factor Prp31